MSVRSLGEHRVQNRSVVLTLGTNKNVCDLSACSFVLSLNRFEEMVPSMNQQSSFERVYQKYGVLLYRVAAIYLGRHHDAEDACQSAFIRLFTKCPRFNDEEHEKAWLVRVTINACKDILKSRERQNVRLTPDIVADIREKSCVIDEIMVLPLLYREALTLHYYCGYSIGEIAGVLRVSQSAVKMRLHRGRELLKLELN